MSKLPKVELIRAIADETGQSQDAIDQTIGALTKKIIEAVKDGNDVSLPGFGTFKRRENAARAGRNPATGEAMEVPASVSLAFKQGQAAKDKLNA